MPAAMASPVTWSPIAAAQRRRQLARRDERVGQAAARPVRADVVAGTIALRALQPVAGEAAVDQPRVAGEHVVVVQAEPAQGAPGARW